MTKNEKARWGNLIGEIVARHDDGSIRFACSDGEFLVQSGEYEVISEETTSSNSTLAERLKAADKASQPTTQADRITAACNELRDLLIRKNHDYGDSFSKQYAKYGMASAMIRMDDKFARLETLRDVADPKVAESKEDTALDIAGYALLLAVELRKEGGK